MKILISTQPDDGHAIAIKLALEQGGADVDLLCIAGFPANTQVSIELTDSEQPRVVFGGMFDRKYSSTFDVVIDRRRNLPDVSPFLDQADVRFAKHEANQVLESVFPFFGESAFWINPWQVSATASLKPIQLKYAGEVGLKIPETLLSNDPNRIISFCDTHGGEIAVKTFSSVAWKKNDESLAQVFTTLVPKRKLEEHVEALSFAPGMYQKYINKAYELRVLVLGQTFLTMKIDNQGDDCSKVDHRMHLFSRNKVAFSEYELPESMRRKLLLLMKKLGLVFSCIDLLVTTKGEYLFLEVNPMGQFLYMEDKVPSLPVLSVFSAFVASQDPNFIWDKKTTLHLSDIADSKVYNHEYDRQFNGFDVQSHGNVFEE